MVKRNVVAEDLFEIHSVANPQISPNGREAVFVKTHINEETNTYVSNLFQVDFDVNEVNQWTYGTGRVSSPKWSVGGAQIAFLSDREGKNQVYILSVCGGEAKKVTSFEGGVISFQWAPCGKEMWVNAAVKEGGTFTDIVVEDDKKLLEPVRVTKMKYLADGVGLLPQDMYRHIGIVNIETGTVTQFTEGNYQYTLQAVSHDGQHIVMSVSYEEDQDFVFRQPLYIVNIKTKEETVLIDEEGYYGGASFSLDDRYIAFTGANRAYENMTQADVFVYDTVDGTRLNLTEGVDAPTGDHAIGDIQQDASAPAVVWTRDNYLYFQLSTMGDVRLYFASLDGAVYPATREKEYIYGYSVAPVGDFALLAVSDATNPGELYKHVIATGERIAITSFNADYINDVELVEPEAIVYQGAEDWDIHGWLMKPVGYQQGEKYPLIVEIHGGPQAMFANAFFHELQLLAAQGYGVLYVNPRGSHGYSQQFVNAVRGDYGGNDYADIMAGLAYAILENDWIDTDRLGVIGGSYGGFMTNWIVGHTTTFKAAVTERSISNWISFFGVSDVGYYFNKWQHGIGNIDRVNIKKLWDTSPLKYAEHIETPLLIMHGENDLRCPIEQAQQLFISLKNKQKETEFVRFPGADHNLSRTGAPNLRIARLGEITSWFAKYL